jgi:hypothetical protein
MVAFAALWPIIDKRLAGFQSPSGVPHSWKGRWENLENSFFPELFSNLNWVLGVRPAPRLPASESWRDFIYIESGYVWLLWIGGLPLCAAFFFFVYVAASRLLRIIQEQDNTVRCAAVVSFTYLMVIITLMLLDPHLTGRGSADFFYPLLALSFVRNRDATNTEASKMGSFAQRYVKRHGPRPPFRPDVEVAGCDPAGNIGRRPSSRSRGDR